MSGPRLPIPPEPGASSGDDARGRERVAAATNGLAPGTPRASLKLELPAELVESIARRAAEIVLERLGAPPAESEFLTVEEAAELLRCGHDDEGRVKRQRVYDLLSDGRLERFKDGSRVLVRRADVVAHLRPTPSRTRSATRSPR